MPPPTPRPWPVVLLLACHALLLAASARVHSVTFDESAHIPSGLSHWQTSTFAAYRVNPPLPRMLAVLPLLAAGPRLADAEIVADRDPFHRPEWALGRRFADDNRDRYHDLVFLARLAGIGWSVLGGVLVYRWGREVYGHRAGLAALALWCFEPTVLGHAVIVTPDVPAAVATLLAAYLFRGWLLRPSWGTAQAAGLGLGVALLTKFTALVLVPVFAVLAAVFAWRPPPGGPRLGPAVRAAQLAAAAGMALAVVHLGYEYRGAGRRLKDVPFVSRAFAGDLSAGGRFPELGGAGNRFRGTWLGELVLPVPEDFARGIDVQRRDFEEMPKYGDSYLAGRWQAGGWWYYYLYGMAVKWPLGQLALLLGAASLGLWRGHPRNAPWREALALGLPAAAVLAAVSSQTGFSHHVRYALPAWPFLLIVAGKLGGLAAPGRWWPAGVAVAGLLAFAAASSLRVYPHSLSYFNEAAGGPENGPAHLLDSNIDWGQDLLFLKDWADAHPECRPLRVVCLSLVDPEVWWGGEAGRNKAAEDDPADFGPQPGYYAVSVNALYGKRVDGAPAGYYEMFREQTPFARIAYSTRIYRFTPDEADLMRRRMGLPPLSPGQSLPGRR